MSGLWEVHEMIKNESDYSEHVQTKHKMKSIYDVETFEELLRRCVLKNVERKVLRMHYLKGNDFRFIGDELGYSERGIKEIHRKALKKMKNLL